MDPQDRTGRAPTASRWFAPLLVLAVGVATVAVVALKLWSDAHDRADQERQQAVDDVAADIDFRMTSYVQALHGVRGLYDASDDVTVEAFSEFIGALGVLEDLPGMRAVGWNRLVRDDEVEEYERLVAATNPFVETDFAVRPLGPEEHLVVEFLVPIAGNEAAFGFDILSESRRAAAVARAEAENQPAATAPVTLVQDTEEVPGILVVLPTWSDGRVGELEGVAVGVFRTGDLLAASAAEIDRRFIVEDIGTFVEVEDSTLLTSPTDVGADREAQAEVDVYGRRWLVSLAENEIAGPTVLGLFLGAATGVGLAIALAWMLFSAQAAARRADELAAVLTIDLHKANEDLTIVGSRLERGVRAAAVVLWEVNTDTGDAWSSTDGGGYDREQSFTDRLHPDDRGRLLSTELPAVGEVAEEEFRLADEDGGYRWVLSRSQTVMRRDEKVVIGAHIDVTDRHEHTELVERLNGDLTKTNQSLRDFTHVASHDLRSPLRAIASLVGFLREDVGDEIGTVTEHHLSRIEARVTRMTRLIDDLLLYARAYGEEGHREPIDVDEVVQEILDTLEVPAGLTIDIRNAIASTQLARTPFSMCVRNLVDNAFKHHDRDDGAVVIDVALDVNADGAFTRVKVTDDGPGIDPDHIDKIFEPFRRLRVDETTPGSGIGLSVIERSAEAHGGRIEVASELGVGTTFTLWWPCDLQPAESSANEMEPSA